VTSSNAIEKERFLEALEKDREFRYAVMGLLGFKELLERFARLEERQQRLEERFVKLEERQQLLEERLQRLEERFAELEERFAKLEERQQKLEERQQRLEERFMKLEERFMRLEERQQRLEERQQKLEERFAELEERFVKLEERQQKLEEVIARVLSELRDLRRIVIVISHRFGILSERAFYEGMRHVVQEILGVAKVEKWVHRDDEGYVYGYPSIVEIDIVIKDKIHILVEVKSRVSRSDVSELYKIGKLYEKIKGIKPRLLIIGGFIDHEAYEAAAKLGIEIKPIVKE